MHRVMALGHGCLLALLHREGANHRHAVDLVNPKFGKPFSTDERFRAEAIGTAATRALDRAHEAKAKSA